MRPRPIKLSSMRRFCEGDSVRWLDGDVQRSGVLQAIDQGRAVVLSTDGRVRHVLVTTLAHGDHEPSGVIEVTRIR